jgi:ubiquinone/menaquinone biosynthesis C-methylase UbiE
MGKVSKEKLAEYQRRWKEKHPDRYMESWKRANAKQIQKYHENNVSCTISQAKCINCGMVFDKDAALTGRIRILKYAGTRCICKECQTYD